MSAGAKKAMADQENKTAEIVSPTPEPASERGHRDRSRRRHRNQPRHLEPSINMNELRELIGLITDNSLTQFELEREDFHVKIGRGPFFDEQTANAQLAADETKRFFELTQKLEQGGEVAHSDVIKAQLTANDAQRAQREAELAMGRTHLELAVLVFQSFNLLSRGYHIETTSHTAQIAETAVLGSSVVNETRFQFYGVDSSTTANSPRSWA